MIPLLVLMLLALVQVGLLVRTRVLVTHAAREGAREAAVGGSDDEIRAAAAGAGSLDPDRMTVAVDRVGGRAEVTITYTAATDVHLVGALLGDVGFRGSATMRVEG